MLWSVLVKCEWKQIRKALFLPLLSLKAETRIPMVHLDVPLLCAVIPGVKHQMDLQDKTRTEKSSLGKITFLITNNK